MSSDESLMLEFQRGSREAFEELFARYREPLYGFFRRRLASRERAEELTQETFLAVIRGTARFEPRALVRTYFYGIAWKLLSSERRRQSKVGTPSSSYPEGALQDSPDTALFPPPENAMSAVRSPCFLTPREREIVALVARGFKDKELAEMMFFSEHTVKHHLQNIFTKTGL